MSEIVRSQRLSVFGSILPDGEIAGVTDRVGKFRLIVEIEKTRGSREACLFRPTPQGCDTETERCHGDEYKHDTQAML